MTDPQMASNNQTEINGLDVQAARETIDAVKADAALAKFQFRAKNSWITGGMNRSTIRDFYGVGREDDSRTADFVFTNRGAVHHLYFLSDCASVTFICR